MRNAILALLSAAITTSALVAWGGLNGTRPAPSRVGDMAGQETSDVPNSPPRIFADGIVEGPRRAISLSFEIPGHIQTVRVHEGDAVKRGEVLAELESDAAELDVLEADVRLKIATAERDRLVASPQHSREDGAIADDKVALADIATRRARFLRDKCRMRAPSDGIVLRAAAEAGELTGPSDERELFTLVEEGATRVRAFVEEMDALNVRPGQRAVVSAAGEPPKQYHGAVAECGRYLRPKLQRNLKPGERVDVQVREVVIELDGDAGLLIGLPVEVFIER